MLELTVIVPIRASATRDIVERISYCLSDPYLDRTRVDFIVIDDGSDDKSRVQHEQKCIELDIKYHYLDTSNKKTNMARARNIGVDIAQTKYIMFMDVDLYPYPGFYSDALREIESQQLEVYKKDLIMFSVIYLSQDLGHKLFFNTDEHQRKSLLLQKLIEHDSSIIDKFSTGTSVAIYHRSRYLELGGYDEKFEQWGYEDIEFNLRVMCSSGKFPLPDELHLDYKDFQTIDQYRGWKSLYELYGDITFQKGVVLFHIWHQVDSETEYMSFRNRNYQRLSKRLLELSSKSEEGDFRIPKESIIFRKYKKRSKESKIFTYYKNSDLIILMQKLKKVPIIGDLLLLIKRKFLSKT